MEFAFYLRWGAASATASAGRGGGACAGRRPMRTWGAWSRPPGPAVAPPSETSGPETQRCCPKHRLEDNGATNQWLIGTAEFQEMQPNRSGWYFYVAQGKHQPEDLILNWRMTHLLMRQRLTTDGENWYVMGVVVQVSFTKHATFLGNPKSCSVGCNQSQNLLSQPPNLHNMHLNM